jgi:hypothetical protein
VKFEPSSRYERIDRRTLGETTAVAWLSREPEDTCWDSFLQETPLGQFQQSTVWARAKRPEGWNPVRMLVTVEDDIVAGFQILWQSSWRGRLGYVSKGPVVLPGHHGLAEYATALLQTLSRKERLRALVVQPPDLFDQTSVKLTNSGFMLEVVTKVIDATWIIDLSDGFEAIEQRMSKQTRRKVKQAEHRGVSIREGGREDLRTFFELMLSTCKRQGAVPNPADERTLYALWDAARPAGCIRLTLAECEGRPLAGLICILFGGTASLWKKGWTSSDGERHPNELLIYESLRWANSCGYRLADVCAFDFGMALTMLRGEPLSPEQEVSRHTFHVRFGGSPQLLPEATVYFPNPLIRAAYRMILRKRLQQAKTKRELVRGVCRHGDCTSMPGSAQQETG